ncbi:N-acetyltransferase [Bacillaceae bacterium SIJ1]|uniref:GNAT family N-acetyltransferase n=1 Tax=Litoribacterium kuwaitense TaxID=1398745 RepID=UPI0013EBBCCF|nr:GNAT family N-acetyltransferase [Litoribacterium kuwaitense]NGP44297.1 N-acetyltransferase [Litoribacterium kuwaitense]
MGLLFQYNTPPGTIGHLFIREGFRQKGLATALVTHALDELRKEGYRYGIIHKSYTHAFFEKQWNALPVPLQEEKRTWSFEQTFQQEKKNQPYKETD